LPWSGEPALIAAVRLGLGLRGNRHASTTRSAWAPAILIAPSSALMKSCDSQLATSSRRDQRRRALRLQPASRRPRRLAGLCRHGRPGPAEVTVSAMKLRVNCASSELMRPPQNSAFRGNFEAKPASSGLRPDTGQASEIRPIPGQHGM
jgi:hypothetical protein